MPENYSTYPSPLVDPRQKGYDYFLQYLKASWSDGKAYTPATMFWFGQGRMDEVKTYALGKQSISKYNKIVYGEDLTDATSGNIDKNPISFLTKFREIAVSKILQRDFDIQATCVDPLAKSEEDTRFNQMKIKVIMKQVAEQQQSSFKDSPYLQAQQGEADNLEDIAMQQKFGFKHQRAMESELGISLIFYQNKIEEIRKRTIENLFDFGIGGYKEWIDENGMVKIRDIDPRNMVISYCLKNDFCDIIYAGEVIYISVSDLSPYFNADQLDYICKNVAGKYGNPNMWPLQNITGRGWDRFKVAVYDMEFIDFDTTVTKLEVDKRGNLRETKTEFINYGNPDTIDFFKGEPEKKYKDYTKKVIRKAKWLIGTDMMYDWGISENMKRKKSSWSDTSLSYHIYSWNFDKMMYGGITERLMTLEDNLCITWYKLQNLRNKLVPYLIKLDLNSLEGVNFAKGGKKMQPSDLIDFMLQDFVVLYRSSDLLTKNPNYDPARIEATGQLQAYKMLYEELQMQLQLMRDITGLNEATDGSTVNSRNLNSTNAAMIESTNNALYPIMNADKQLISSLADAVVQRIQVAVQLGKVEGYAKALGNDTVQFMQISPEISNYDFGIFVKDAPSYEERQVFIQDLNLKDSQGLIDPQDKLIVMSCTNLKQAGELLAYNIQKRKEQAQSFEMQKIQENNEGQKQMALAVEQLKQENYERQVQLELQKIVTEKMWEFEIEKMKKSADVQGESLQVEGRTIGHAIQADAKVEAARIAAETRKKAAVAKK